MGNDIPNCNIKTGSTRLAPRAAKARFGAERG
jgi:hypothetical protein